MTEDKGVKSTRHKDCSYCGAKKVSVEEILDVIDISVDVRDKLESCEKNDMATAIHKLVYGGEE